MRYEPDTPTPRRMFNMGPPKQAENPMMGANTWWSHWFAQYFQMRSIKSIQRTATLIFATRSAREFPTAKMVRPIMASESPKMKPNVLGGTNSVTHKLSKGSTILTWRTLTTSSAIAMIQTMATRKPSEQRIIRPAGLRPVSAKVITKAPSEIPITKVPMHSGRAYHMLPGMIGLSDTYVIPNRTKGSYQIELEHRIAVQGHTARQ